MWVVLRFWKCVCVRYGVLTYEPVLTVEVWDLREGWGVWFTVMVSPYVLGGTCPQTIWSVIRRSETRSPRTGV